MFICKINVVVSCTFSSESMMLKFIEKAEDLPPYFSKNLSLAHGHKAS